MKEYTLVALTSSLLVILLDAIVLKTRVLTQKTFWIFLLVMYAFKTLVNGYLTWRPIVLYGEQFHVGIRIFTIPIEDYIYGFSLMTMSVVLWEYFNRRMNDEE